MKKILTSHLQIFEISKWNEFNTKTAPIKFYDKSSALNFLQNLLHDSINMCNLRNFIIEEGFRSDVYRLEDYEVCELVAQQLTYGSIKIMPIASSFAISSRTTASQEDKKTTDTSPQTETFTQSTATTPQEIQMNWIKFYVLYEETGEPVTNVPMELKLPNGNNKEYTTDANGMVYITDLPKGTWDIKNILDSEALEVVRIE